MLKLGAAERAIWWREKMRWKIATILGIWTLAGASAAMAAQADAVAVPDYAQAAIWLCRPGMDDGACSANLEAVAIDAKGRRTPVPYKADPNAPIDCFYVYPTASNDPGVYSDLIPGAEERGAVRRHVARLGSICRVFAPVYRQFTVTQLLRNMNTGQALAADWLDKPYADILAAWRYYLAHDNGGRGVVLIGHSQGAAVLKRLIAEEIDGKPAQKLLVAAYLSGNLDLNDKSFRSIRPCARKNQTGCVVGWSSALDSDRSALRFGVAGAGSTAICVNPAAPAGGRGVLTAYLPRPATAPATDPPFVKVVGGLSAECLREDGRTLLRVHIEPGAYAETLRGMLENPHASGWGLHSFDVGLVQGDTMEMIAAQSAAWRAAR